MDVDQFKKYLQEKPVVLAYFSYPQCTVCKALRPKVEALGASYDQVDFLYVDTHQNRQLAGQYSIFAAPTLVIFVEGKEYKRLSRHFSITDIHAFLERIFSLMN